MHYAKYGTFYGKYRKAKRKRRNGSAGPSEMEGNHRFGY